MIAFLNVVHTYCSYLPIELLTFGLCCWNCHVKFHNLSLISLCWSQLQLTALIYFSWFYIFFFSLFVACCLRCEYSIWFPMCYTLSVNLRYTFPSSMDANVAYFLNTKNQYFIHPETFNSIFFQYSSLNREHKANSCLCCFFSMRFDLYIFCKCLHIEKKRKNRKKEKRRNTNAKIVFDSSDSRRLLTV